MGENRWIRKVDKWEEVDEWEEMVQYGQILTIQSNEKNGQIGGYGSLGENR